MILAELVGGPEDGRRIEIDCPRRVIYVYDGQVPINVLPRTPKPAESLEVPVVEYQLRDCRGGVHYYDHPRLRRA